MAVQEVIDADGQALLQGMRGVRPALRPAPSLPGTNNLYYLPNNRRLHTARDAPNPDIRVRPGDWLCYNTSLIIK